MSVEILRARPLLGTLVEIRARAPCAARAERAVRLAFAAVERVQARMSFFESGSDVSRLNRRALHRSVRVARSTYRVLRHAHALHAASGGLFDIAMAAELVRGGWLPRPAKGPSRSTATTAAIALLPGRRVRFRRPLLIDLGGIAKGFAVDQAIAALRRAGATGATVNAGGDLRAFGRSGQPVHVRLPRAPGTLVAGGTIRAGAVATSGHYFARRRLRDGWRAPICDPRSRRFAGEVRSVTVFARECWLADALCKVVWLGGPDALPLLKRHGARACWLGAPFARRQGANGAS